MRPPARTSNAEPWVSIQDVALHVGVRKDSIYRWIEGRGLPATKVGKLWKLKLSEVDAWMRAQRESVPASEPPRRARAASRLVLVVDDERLIRESVCELVSDLGHEALAAADGEEAMALLAGSARLPDLILLDLKMPGVDGWNFRARQLQDPRLAAIPVIVVTAAREPGIEGTLVLKKPLQLDALTAAIRERLDARTIDQGASS